MPHIQKVSAQHGHGFPLPTSASADKANLCRPPLLVTDHPKGGCGAAKRTQPDSSSYGPAMSNSRTQSNRILRKIATMSCTIRCPQRHKGS